MFGLRNLYGKRYERGLGGAGNSFLFSFKFYLFNSLCFVKFQEFFQNFQNYKEFHQKNIKISRISQQE